MQSLRPTEPEPWLDPNSRGEGGCGSGSGTHPHLRPPGLTRRWLSGDLVRLAGQAGHVLVCRVTSPCAGSGRLWPPLRSPTPDSPLSDPRLPSLLPSRHLPPLRRHLSSAAAPLQGQGKARARLRRRPSATRVGVPESPGPGTVPGAWCSRSRHLPKDRERRGGAGAGHHVTDRWGLRHLWGDSSSRPPAAPTASQWKWVFTS